MDETPEEMAQNRTDAAKIDPYKYRKRRRALTAFALGGLLAGGVWLVMTVRTQTRNPCQRVREHFCGQSSASMPCKTWDGILEESENDPSPKMRSLVRKQCETKIKRLKEEEGVTVR